MNHELYKQRQAEILDKVSKDYLTHDEAAQRLDKLMLDVIGQDESLPSLKGSARQLTLGGNLMRAELRQIIKGKDAV